MTTAAGATTDDALRREGEEWEHWRVRTGLAVDDAAVAMREAEAQRRRAIEQAQHEHAAPSSTLLRIELLLQEIRDALQTQEAPASEGLSATGESPPARAV